MPLLGKHFYFFLLSVKPLHANIDLFPYCPVFLSFVFLTASCGYVGMKIRFPLGPEEPQRKKEEGVYTDTGLKE